MEIPMDEVGTDGAEEGRSDPIRGRDRGLLAEEAAVVRGVDPGTG